MKKIIILSCLIVGSTQLFGNHSERNARFDGMFSSGYVFKNDSKFKDVYGHGAVNAITGDFCYYPWQLWGLGAKVSYWRAKGRTTFLDQRTIFQEVPITAYVRRKKEFDCGLQLYGSLGAGFAWVKEKSYLGNAHFNKGIGEIEAGMIHTVWRWLTVGAAIRYLFPPQSQCGKSRDVGGVDLRAGLGFQF